MQFFAHLWASSISFNKDIFIYTPFSEWLFDMASPGLHTGSSQHTITSWYFVPSVFCFKSVAVAEGYRQRGLVAYHKLCHRSPYSLSTELRFSHVFNGVFSQLVQNHHVDWGFDKSLITYRIRKISKIHAKNRQVWVSYYNPTHHNIYNHY